MNFPDFQKIIIQASEQSLKRIALFNPLTIRKKGTKAKAIFALALVCIFWGTTWIASKTGVTYMPALQLAGMRQLMGGICFVLFFLYKKEPWPKGWAEWKPVLILSCLNFFLSNGLSTWGVKFISAGLGAIIGAIFPLWIVIIGLFTGNRMPSKAVAGMLLGFAGICVIFYEHLGDFLDADFSFGIIISLGATWAWAFGTIYTKKHAANFNPYFSLGLQMMISGIAVVILTIITGTSIPFTSIPWQSWAAMGYLLAFGSLLSFIAYIYALKNLPTEQVSIYAYINPIVAVSLGAAVFSEKLTVFIAVGGLVTLLGVYLVNRAFRSIPPPEQPEPEGM